MDYDFSLLPIEVIEIIFNYLNIDDIKDSSLTCHRWFEASQNPKIIERTQICFENQLPAQNLILNSLRKFTAAVFDSIDFKDLTVEDIDFWRKFGKTITSLSFRYCTFNEQTLLNILDLFPNLTILLIKFQVHKELNCDILLPKYVDKLKSITLKSTYPISENAFQTINNKTSTIEKLTFDISVMPENSTMTPTIKTLNKLTESLKSLSLYFYPEDIDVPQQLSEMENLHLESLKFQFCDEIELTLFTKFIHKLSTLINLDISMTIIEDSSFIEICTFMPQLKGLRINECDTITNKGIIELIKLKNLERLVITECHNISNEGIIQGIAKYRNEKMKEISLSGYFSDDSLIGISQNLPNLRSLEIYTILFLSNRCPRTIFQHLRWLRILRLDSLNSESDKDMFSPHEINQTLIPSSSDEFNISCVKGLQYLLLSGFPNILGASLDDISNLTELIHLKLSYFGDMSESGLNNLTQNCRSLKKIEFSDCETISLNQIECLLTPLQRLNTLNIRQKGQIDGESLKLLKSKYKHVDINVNKNFMECD